MFALLGDIIFETLTSPEAFRAASEYHFAEHKVVEAAPRLQWIANELQKISLELSFHAAFTNPATQMNRLRTAAEDHQARALIFGNGVHRGYFVIETLEETHHQLADDGSYIAISARVELREWIPGADFDPLAPPRRTTPPPGIAQQDPPPASAAGTLASTSVPGQTPMGIVNLSGTGVSYRAIAYSQPGVSAIAGVSVSGLSIGNPDSVAPSVIVRAG